MSDVRVIYIGTATSKLFAHPTWFVTDEEARVICEGFRDAFGLSAHTPIDAASVRPNHPKRFTVPIPDGADRAPLSPEVAKHQLWQHFMTLLPQLSAAIEVT